ncbi:nicotinate phosphoribosyltransferase, partial [Coxiella burnetii]
LEKGKRIFEANKPLEIMKFSQQRLGFLPLEYKRFNNPHIYKIGLSDGLNNKRNQLIEAYKKT